MVSITSSNLDVFGPDERHGISAADTRVILVGEINWEEYSPIEVYGSSLLTEFLELDMTCDRDIRFFVSRYGLLRWNDYQVTVSDWWADQLELRVFEEMGRLLRASGGRDERSLRGKVIIETDRLVLNWPKAMSNWQRCDLHRELDQGGGFKGYLDLVRSRDFRGILSRHMANCLEDQLRWHAGFSVVEEPDPVAEPLFRPSPMPLDLLGAMWLQAARLLGRSADIRRCQNVACSRLYDAMDAVRNPGELEPHRRKRRSTCDRKYCSSACRQEAYRRKKKAAAC